LGTAGRSVNLDIPGGLLDPFQTTAWYPLTPDFALFSIDTKAPFFYTFLIRKLLFIIYFVFLLII
jgi:hypothetical protein